MAPLAPKDQNNISSIVQQSEPIDLSAPYDPRTLKGKTILLTGGATGLGAAFARRWASHGAHLIIGDVNDAAGEAIVAELRAGSTHDRAHSSSHHHYIHTDVTSWDDQARLFRRAATQLSTTGEIDVVVSCAGVSDREGTITGGGLENPGAHVTGTGDPVRPDLRCVQVNLIGTMYTAHLALFWLQKNSTTTQPTTTTTKDDPRDARDRHLLLIGSSAGFSFLPGVPEYVTSKHGVTGLFRALRGLSYRQGVRVNMLCPYFVDTPILPGRAVALMSGNGIGRLDDAVDAATRLVSASGTGTIEVESGGGGGDEKKGTRSAQRIAGRALLVGPRAPLRRRVMPDRELAGFAEGALAAEELELDDPARDVLLEEDLRAGQGQAAWEVYAHDFETVDFFIRRYIRLLNTISAVRGWVGFWLDLLHVLFVRKEPKPARHRA